MIYFKEDSIKAAKEREQQAQGGGTSPADKAKLDEIGQQLDDLTGSINEVIGTANAAVGLSAALHSVKVTTVSEIAAGERSGTDVIACEELLPAWTKAGPKGDGSHEVGEPCTHEGQAWRCCQAHNCNNNPDIEPGKSPAQWAPYHTTDPAKAKPFIQPTGAHDAYQKGEVALWTDGFVYRSIMETANAYSPADYPQGWEKVDVGGAG